MKNEFTEKVNIKQEWCDGAGTLTLKGLANILEGQADRHLSLVNMSGADFLKQGMAWVIVRRESHIKRLPAQGETVEVTTWSGSFRHGICPRWFEIYDGEGEKIIDVSCQWVVLDVAQREIIFKDDFMSNLPFCDKSYYGKPVTAARNCPELTERISFTVSNEWIDKNGHVNNSYYLKWVGDIAAKESKGRQVSYLWIEYSREIMVNDLVEVCWNADGAEMYFCGYANGDHENRMFYALVELEDNQGIDASSETKTGEYGSEIELESKASLEMTRKAISETENKSHYITDEIIAQLYDEYKTPEHVKRHCKGVTDCALGIARALNAVGYKFDLDLIYGAGMVHDMARTSDSHWTVAADKLDEMGFHREAAIVRVHMEPGEYSPVDSLTEKDMICLGDRLVKEDQYVGIDERFEYIVNKAKRYGVLNFDKIMMNKAKMQQCLDSIEAKIGCSIDELFK